MRVTAAVCGGWGAGVFAPSLGLPVIAVLVGFIAVFIGIADMKDRAEAKKEKAEESLAKLQQ